jgi:hypothetical protein
VLPAGIGCLGGLTLGAGVELELVGVAAEPISEVAMLDQFRALVAKDMEVTRRFRGPQDPVAIPPRLTYAQFKPHGFESR